MKDILVRKVQTVTRSQQFTKTNFLHKFLKGLSFGLIGLVVVVVPGVSPLYGQSAGDALFIDANGNVGIGTSAPQATLDVAGKLNVSDSATITESLTAGTLNVNKNATLADTTVKRSIKLNCKSDTALLNLSLVLEQSRRKSPSDCGWIL